MLGSFQIIKIELSQQDAEIFKTFCKFRDDFENMLNAGVFEFKNGSATLYRDSNGILKDIEIKVKTYQRKKNS